MVRIRVTAPTQGDLDALPVEKRLELLELERQRSDALQARQDAKRERLRQSRHQWINSAVLLAGVILAAVTWRTGQEELRTGRDQLVTAQQGQVTERYTRAVEQLGSGRRDVRVAAIYALERIARDSEPDRLAIRDVLGAYIREHGPNPAVKDDKLPSKPDTDIQTALTVLTRRPADPADAPHLDLEAVQAPGLRLSKRANLLRADLRRVNLHGAIMFEANLFGADMRGANLSEAFMDNSDLTGVDLVSADLTNTTLTKANLFNAALTKAVMRGTGLIGANLTSIDLTGADLRGAALNNANLREAALTNADLTNASLDGANLSGADLRGVRGISEAEIRKVATTNTETQFGQSPWKP